jgi:hypothetical protein
LKDQGRVVEHSQLGDSRLMQGHVFANRLSRDWRCLEEKQRLGYHPGYQQEGAGRDSQHNERPEMMILRLSAQCCWWRLLSFGRIPFLAS